MINFIRKIRKKLVYAFHGIVIIFKEENSFPFYLLWAIVLVVLGIIFKISIFEWIFILITFGIVVVLEIINTAIENLADQVSLQFNIKIKKIKDLSACATLTMLAFGLVVDLLIFIPAIIAYFQ